VGQVLNSYLLMARHFLICVLISIFALTAWTEWTLPDQIPTHAHPEPPDSHLIIMSFNVRGSDLDQGPTTQTWATRRPLALDLLSKYKPDILGVQEPPLEQLADFTSIQVTSRHNVRFRYQKVGSFDPVSILYNPHVARVVESETVWLSETRAPYSKSWDAAHPRVMTIAIFTTTLRLPDPDGSKKCSCQKIKPVDKTFMVINTHFDHIGYIARVKSAEIVNEHIYKYTRGQYPDIPIFVMGDFNSAKYGPAWEAMTTHGNGTLQDSLHNSQIILHQPLIQYTFHHFHGVHLNYWWKRSLMYFLFGVSCIEPEIWRNYTLNVACFGPPIYTSIYRRLFHQNQAGVHHIDWILHSPNNTWPTFFSVLTEHAYQGDTEITMGGWLDYFHKRIVEKSIEPSDHFPVIAGFNFTDI